MDDPLSSKRARINSANGNSNLSKSISRRDFIKLLSTSMAAALLSKVTGVKALSELQQESGETFDQILGRLGIEILTFQETPFEVVDDFKNYQYVILNDPYSRNSDGQTEPGRLYKVDLRKMGFIEGLMIPTVDEILRSNFLPQGLDENEKMRTATQLWQALNLLEADMQINLQSHTFLTPAVLTQGNNYEDSVTFNQINHMLFTLLLMLNLIREDIGGQSMFNNFTTEQIASFREFISLFSGLVTPESARSKSADVANQVLSIDTIGFREAINQSVIDIPENLKIRAVFEGLVPGMVEIPSSITEGGNLAAEIDQISVDLNETELQEMRNRFIDTNYWNENILDRIPQQVIDNIFYGVMPVGVNPYLSLFMSGEINADNVLVYRFRDSTTFTAQEQFIFQSTVNEILDFVLRVQRDPIQAQPEIQRYCKLLFVCFRKLMGLTLSPEEITVLNKLDSIDGDFSATAESLILYIYCQWSFNRGNDSILSASVTGNLEIDKTKLNDIFYNSIPEDSLPFQEGESNFRRFSRYLQTNGQPPLPDYYNAFPRLIVLDPTAYEQLSMVSNIAQEEESGNPVYSTRIIFNTPRENNGAIINYVDVKFKRDLQTGFYTLILNSFDSSYNALMSLLQNNTRNYISLSIHDLELANLDNYLNFQRQYLLDYGVTYLVEKITDNLLTPSVYREALTRHILSQTHKKIVALTMANNTVSAQMLRRLAESNNARFDLVTYVNDSGDSGGHAARFDQQVGEELQDAIVLKADPLRRPEWNYNGLIHEILHSSDLDVLLIIIILGTDVNLLELVLIESLKDWFHLQALDAIRGFATVDNRSGNFPNINPKQVEMTYLRDTLRIHQWVITMSLEEQDLLFQMLDILPPELLQEIKIYFNNLDNTGEFNPTPKDITKRDFYNPDNSVNQPLVNILIFYIVNTVNENYQRGIPPSFNTAQRKLFAKFTNGVKKHMSHHFLGQISREIQIRTGSTPIEFKTYGIYAGPKTTLPPVEDEVLLSNTRGLVFPDVPQTQMTLANRASNDLRYRYHHLFSNALYLLAQRKLINPSDNINMSLLLANALRNPSTRSTLGGSTGSYELIEAIAKLTQPVPLQIDSVSTSYGSDNGVNYLSILLIVLDQVLSKPEDPAFDRQYMINLIYPFITDLYYLVGATREEQSVRINVNGDLLISWFNSIYSNLALVESNRLTILRYFQQLISYIKNTEMPVLEQIALVTEISEEKVGDFQLDIRRLNSNGSNTFVASVSSAIEFLDEYVQSQIVA